MYDSETKAVLHKDNLYVSNHNTVSQMQGIDIVSDVLDNEDNNFITVQEEKEPERVENDEFIDIEEGGVEGNHSHSTGQIPVFTEDVLFELRQSSYLHRNNNYKGDEFGNSNDLEVDVADNRPNFQTQNTVNSVLNDSDDKVTFFRKAVKFEVSEGGDGIPENNNELEFEMKDVGKLCSISRSPSVLLENDGDNVVFEYSGKVEEKVCKVWLNMHPSSGEVGNTEAEGTDDCSSVDEIGIDSTDLINGSEIHVNSNNLFEISSCSDLNIDPREMGTGKGTETTCGQTSPSHSIVETIFTDNSYNHNITRETEDDVHSRRETVSSYVTTFDNSSVDSSVRVQEFAVAGNYQIINCNSEIHITENDSDQRLETLQSHQENAKFCMKTIFKKSTVDINSPIVDSLERFNYGSTKTASFVNDRFCHNIKHDINPAKPIKNKKKEPHIT